MEDIIGDIESVGSSFQSMVQGLLEPFIEYNNKGQGEPKPKPKIPITEVGDFGELKPSINAKKANDLLNNVITAAKNSNAGFSGSAVQEAIEAYAEYTGDKTKGKKVAQENVNTLYGYFPDVTTDSLAAGHST